MNLLKKRQPSRKAQLEALERNTIYDTWAAFQAYNQGHKHYVKAFLEALDNPVPRQRPEDALPSHRP